MISNGSLCSPFPCPASPRLGDRSSRSNGKLITSDGLLLHGDTPSPPETSAAGQEHSKSKVIPLRGARIPAAGPVFVRTGYPVPWQTPKQLLGPSGTNPATNLWIWLKFGQTESRAGGTWRDVQKRGRARVLRGPPGAQCGTRLRLRGDCGRRFGLRVPGRSHSKC